MAESSAQIEPLQGAGLTVHRDETLQAATLRYFGGDGAFAAALREVSGVALPEVLRATSARGGEIILAWRSPTETLLLAGELALSELETRVAQAADGCAGAAPLGGPAPGRPRLCRAPRGMDQPEAAEVWRGLASVGQTRNGGSGRKAGR